jgi:hypothetical protein
LEDIEGKTWPQKSANNAKRVEQRKGCEHVV